MAEIHCYIPIRIRITGMPDDEQLDRLVATIQDAVAQRIALADRTTQTAAGGPSHGAIEHTSVAEAARSPATADPADVSERREAGPEGADGFTIPSYAGGRPAQVPDVARRRWIVLRALNFRARVDDFLAALANVRGEAQGGLARNRAAGPARRAGQPRVERREGFLLSWPVCGAGRADGKRARRGLVGGGTVPMTARGRCGPSARGMAAAPGVGTVPCPG